MELNNIFNVVVKDGYTMLALVSADGIFHAVIFRERTGDFVYCWNYDIEDGTWGQGHYFTYYASAIKEMASHFA